MIQAGTAVNFAFDTAQGVAISSPTFSGHFMQRVGQGKLSDLAQVRSGTGSVATDVFYDDRDEAELTFVIGSATNQADAKTKTTLSAFAPGTFVVIATSANRPDLVATNWVVSEQGPRLEGDNTTPASIVIPIRKRSGITAVAS